MGAAKNTTRLRDFIDKFGQKKLSEELGVDITTVNKWRMGHGLPKAEVMLELKEISHGHLTPDLMIEEYFEVDSNRGKYAR